jgi:hypothetical protein
VANDLLYKASLHLGDSPQNKRSSLLYKILTVGNRQHKPASISNVLAASNKVLFSLSEIGLFQEYKAQNMWQDDLQVFPIFCTPFTITMNSHYANTCIFNFEVISVRGMNLPHLKLRLAVHGDNP